MSEERLPRPTPAPPFFSVPEGSSYLHGQSPILDGMLQRRSPVTRAAFLALNFPSGLPDDPDFNVEETLPDFLRATWPETYAEWLELERERGRQRGERMLKTQRVLAAEMAEKFPSRTTDEWEEFLAAQ